MMTKFIERSGQFFGFSRAPKGPPEGATKLNKPSEPRWVSVIVRPTGSGNTGGG